MSAVFILFKELNYNIDKKNNHVFPGRNLAWDAKFLVYVTLFYKVVQGVSIKHGIGANSKACMLKKMPRFTEQNSQLCVNDCVMVSFSFIVP